MKINGFISTNDNSSTTRTQTENEFTPIKELSSTKDVPANVKSQQDVPLDTETRKGEHSISDKALNNAIEKANKVLDGTNRKFEVSVHKATNEIMVKVLDSDTGEVIREIPPEKILDMVAMLWEMAGLIVDERR